MLLFRKRFDRRPGASCGRGVVIHFDHSPDDENPEPCLRISRFRQCKVLCQGPNLLIEISGFHMGRHLADVSVQSFRRFVRF